MTTSRQVKMLVKKHGVRDAVEIIKDDRKKFTEIQNYPNGVLVYVTDELGQVMVGSKQLSRHC